MTAAGHGLQGLVLRFRSSYGLSDTTARHHFIAARRFASVRSIRRAIEGLGDGDLVAVEFPEGGGLEVRPVNRLGD